jgi:hypothetical protein
MTISQLFLAALLEMFPYMSGNNRVCMVRNFNSIANVAEEARRDLGVPPAVLLTVGFLETHNGCDQGEGGNWGAPISPTQRHTAGSPRQAAVALQHGFERCGSWVGAISRFRSGSCRIPETMRSYTRSAVRIMTQISNNIAVSIPEYIQPFCI